jgi:methionyl-tRNA formyltransferase
VKAVVFGVREFGCVGLEELLGLEVKVPLVVTGPRDPSDPPGYRSLADAAREAGIAVTTPVDAGGRALLDWVRGVRPDVMFSFHYRHAIPRTVRRVAGLGAYNLHLSLLPRWRGRWPIPFVILAGERESGITLHEMVEEFDAGDVVGQVAFPVAPRETATDLYDKSLGAVRLLLRRAVPLILERRAPRSPQDPAGATVCPALEPRRHVDRSASVDRFDRTVRAFAPPYPGALVPLGGEFATVWEGKPGEGPGGIPLQLADGVYRVLRLSFGDAADLEWGEFLRRFPDAPELLGRPRPPGRRARDEEE